MPKSYLFPEVPSLPLLVTLTADAVFTANLLGAIVELAGFTLTLAEVDGHGSFSLTGPGDYTGVLTGSVETGEAVLISTNGSAFNLTGNQVVGVTIGAVTGLTAALAAKAPAAHTHAQADVTGLTTSLTGKAAASHTHAIDQVTGLEAAIADLIPAPLELGAAPLSDAATTSIAIFGTLSPNITTLVLQQITAGTLWSSDGNPTAPVSGIWIKCQSISSPLNTFKIFRYVDGVYTGQSWGSYSAATPVAAVWGLSTTGGATGVPVLSYVNAGGTEGSVGQHAYFPGGIAEMKSEDPIIWTVISGGGEIPAPLHLTAPPLNGVMVLAGITSPLGANGSYFETGRTNGRAAYGSGGIYYQAWNGVRWEVKNEAGTVFFYSNNDVLYPNLATAWVATGTGTGTLTVTCDDSATAVSSIYQEAHVTAGEFTDVWKLTHRTPNQWVPQNLIRNRLTLQWERIFIDTDGSQTTEPAYP